MSNVVDHVPDPDEAKARRGMISPSPVVLELGSYIYRFASQTERFSFGYQAGAWWIFQKDFEEIMARAERAGKDLGQKARWDLAILPSWGSLMNIVVEARVVDRITGWTGLAKPQQETTANGKVIRLFGNRGIKQLYVGGLTDEFGMLTPRGRQCVAVTGAKVIPASTAI